MATHHDRITAKQAELIREAALFFVASTHPELCGGPQGQGPVNVSPKGGVPLAMISDRQVAYLDHHGSGNETARHASDGGPITLMVCSLDRADAAIVRLYGRARVEALDDSPLAAQLLEDQSDTKGLRQVVVVDVEHTQTSCGYGVPIYSYVGPRDASQRGRRFKD